MNIFKKNVSHVECFVGSCTAIGAYECINQHRWGLLALVWIGWFAFCCFAEWNRPDEDNEEETEE